MKKKSPSTALNGTPRVYGGAARRQIIGQFPTKSRALKMTQQKPHCSRCPLDKLRDFTEGGFLV